MNTTIIKVSGRPSSELQLSSPSPVQKPFPKSLLNLRGRRLTTPFKSTSDLGRIAPLSKEPPRFVIGRRQEIAAAILVAWAYKHHGHGGHQQRWRMIPRDSASTLRPARRLWSISVEDLVSLATSAALLHRPEEQITAPRSRYG